jgi:hypothetical protein
MSTHVCFSFVLILVAFVYEIVSFTFMALSEWSKHLSWKSKLRLASPCTISSLSINKLTWRRRKEVEMNMKDVVVEGRFSSAIASVKRAGVALQSIRCC